MDVDEDVGEVLSAAIQPLSTTMSTQIKTSTGAANGSPSLRRSMRLRRISGESSSTAADRLLHRTSTGGIGSTPTQTARQSAVSKRSTSSSTSTNRRTVPLAVVDDLVGGRANDAGNCSNQSSISTTDQLASSVVDVSSDDDTGNNNLNARSYSTRSIVLENFVEEENGFRCKFSKEVYKTSRMSDSNLRLHLGTVHGMDHLLFPSQRKKTLSTKTGTLPSERRAELHRAAINCIVDDSLPFGAFRRRGMTEFLSVAVPGYIGPHRTTVRRHLHHLYKKHRNILRKIVASSPWIALTSDTWMSSRRKRFICLTGHFFTESFEQISLVLGFRCVSGRSLAKTLRAYIAHEIRSLKIADHQLIAITTDAGADIKNVTAAGTFGQPMVCLAHILHLIVTKGLFIWKKPDKQKFPLLGDMDDLWIDDDTSYDDQEANISEEEDDNPEDDQSNEVNNDLPLDEDDDDDEEEFDCSSDTELNTSDDLSDRSTTAATDIDLLFTLLTQCHGLFSRIRSVVKFIRNNGVIRDYIRAQRAKIKTTTTSMKKEMTLDVRIRWNSSYEMLSRFLWHKDIVKAIVISPKKIDGITKDQISTLKKFVFQHEEWDLMESLKQALKPFVLVTKALSGRNYPTIALAMLMCRDLLSFLQKDSTDKYLRHLKKSLLYQFNCYINGKVEEIQKQYMLIAAFLEPDVYCRLTDDERKLAKKQILDKMKSVDSLASFNTLSYSNQQTTTTNVTAVTDISSSTTSTLNILDQLAEMCGVPSTITAASRNSTKLPTYDEELSLYVAKAKEGGEFRSFWNTNKGQLPRLCQLVKRYCIIPATSVASEAAFSQAGYIQRKQRSSLSPKTLQYSVLLKDRQLVNKLDSSIQ